ncbi:MAG: FAD-dependent oxidoreductase [Clostridia bacterium]|nr:FAD-dependent oxidoreductase [Clostridia bacterium]
MIYDSVIVGAGPAGLCAALYLARAEKRVLLIEKAAFGGQITFSPKIENYPGIPAASGNEIADILLSQVMELGVEIEVDEVVSVEEGEDKKRVVTAGGVFEAYSVILATGAHHRLLGLEGEDALIGEGISFCAVCDGAFYKGKDVIVIGGGNSAKQEAILLAKLCKKVTVLQNLPYLTGEKKLSDELLALDNVEVVYSATVTAYLGDGEFRGVKASVAGEERAFYGDACFLAIGLAPNLQTFDRLVALDPWGYAEADETCETKTAGIFVAGDCRRKRIRQISTATADGVNAAMGVISYLDSIGV